MRVIQVEYPVYAGSRRGYELQVQDGGGWLENAGFSEFHDAIATALGLDPTRTAVASLGMGLERIACLRYGIRDVRQVEASRVDD